MFRQMLAQHMVGKILLFGCIFKFQINLICGIFTQMSMRGSDGPMGMTGAVGPEGIKAAII